MWMAGTRLNSSTAVSPVSSGAVLPKYAPGPASIPRKRRNKRKTSTYPSVQPDSANVRLPSAAAQVHRKERLHSQAGAARQPVNHSPHSAADHRRAGQHQQRFPPAARRQIHHVAKSQQTGASLTTRLLPAQTRWKAPVSRFSTPLFWRSIERMGYTDCRVDQAQAVQGQNNLRANIAAGADHCR